MFHLAESGFGNWLYIVFGIIYFLYQIFSASKKKNKNPSPQTNIPGEDESAGYPDSSPSQNPLEEFFDKLKDLEKQKNPTNTPEKAPVHTVQQTEVKPVKKAISPKEKSVKRSAPMEVIEVENTENTGLVMGVAIRDAVIASEILKRPEY